MPGSTIDYGAPQGKPKTPIGKVDKAIGYVNLLQDPFMLLLRIYFGYWVITAGWGHLHNIDKTADFFRELNIPFPVLNVYISGMTELAGGTLLLLGLLSRPIAVPLVFNFIVAIVSVNWEYPKYRDMLLHPFTGDNFTTAVLHDDAFPFLFISLLVFLFGPGRFSLDHLVLKRLFHRNQST